MCVITPTQVRAEPIRVACVGDSITEGTANADYRRNSYPQILGRLLEASFPSEYDVRNFGVSGATMLKNGHNPYWKHTAYTNALAFKPHIVIINLGTNDAVAMNWNEHGDEYEEDYRALISEFAALPTTPRLLLSNLTPLYPNFLRLEECAPARRSIAETLARLGREYDAPIIDFETPLLDKQLWFPDGLHPNTAGNEQMAKAAFGVITGDVAPGDASIRPMSLPGNPHALVKGGQTVDCDLGAWVQSAEWIEGTGAKKTVAAGTALGEGDFHVRARLRMLNQQNSAAGFYWNDNFFGFEGARGTLFRNGPANKGLRLLHPAPMVFDRDAWIDFEVIRNDESIWFLINGFIADMTLFDGAVHSFGFDPTRSRMQIESWSVIGNLEERPPVVPRGYDIPVIDLDGEAHRQTVVDREEGQYLGHPTTVLLEDGRTILCVYPKGHGRGGIVYKRSTDGGLTWSPRLETPESWRTSREVPTIHRVIDPTTGQKRLIMWSGLYPARLAVSEDDGETWSELVPAGEWGGIVVMGCLERLSNGSYVALFHDDGRFFTENGQASGVFTLYQTFSHDGGLTWTHPESIWSGSDVHLCEPGIIRSPDGRTLAILLRENARRRNSHVMFTSDECKTWSEPRELPAALTGDRHTAQYAPDGRLFISFRDTTLESETQGDWVGWVGTWDDIIHGKSGQYRVRLRDNKHRWDCAYPGVLVLPDGTFVVTTYGHWEEGEEPYILTVHFTLDELDERAAGHVTKSDLFLPTMRDTAIFRIPALAMTNAGTLIACCDARVPHGRDLPNHIDTVIRRSTDNGMTWTPIETIIDNDAPLGTADPCLLVDRKTGRIWVGVTWADGVNWRTSQPGFGRDSFHTLLVYSDDDGHTWSEATDITRAMKDPAWGSTWFSPGTGLQSRSGRLFLPYSVADAAGEMYSFAAVSDDHGETWTRVGPIGVKTNEFMLAQRRDGAIVANLRSVSGLNRRAISVSHDDGATWSNMRHHDGLVEPVCQGSLLTIPADRSPDGREWMVFCNPASTRRERLTIKVSWDGGDTWPKSYMVHEGPAAYSSLVLLEDGVLGVLYECGEESPYEGISFARVPLRLFR